MSVFKKYVIGILLGILVGMLTLVGQKYLPINFNFLANSGAIWLIPAFCTSYFGKMDKKHSILVCIICLLCCVYGYYSFEAIMNHHLFTFNFHTMIWTACALAGGVIFGLGAYFANNKQNWLKYCGKNLLPAVFISEGVNKIIHISEYMHMVFAVIMVTAIGIILYFVISRQDCLNKNCLLSVGAITLLGLIGYEIIYRIA